MTPSLSPKRVPQSERSGLSRDVSGGRTTSGSLPPTLVSYLTEALSSNKASQRRVTFALSAFVVVLLWWSRDAKIDISAAGMKIELGSAMARDLCTVLTAILIAKIGTLMAYGAVTAARLSAQLGVELTTDDKHIASIELQGEQDVKHLFTDRSLFYSVAYGIYWISTVVARFLSYLFQVAVVGCSSFLVLRDLLLMDRSPSLGKPLDLVAIAVASSFLTIGLMGIIQYWIVRRAAN